MSREGRIAGEASTKKMIRIYAIRIDVTCKCDRDWLEGFRPWAPRIWSVWIARPGQPSYLGSLTPSSMAFHVCTHADLPARTPGEIAGQIEASLPPPDDEMCYLDFKLVQGIIKEGTDALDLGLFRTEDESLTDCQDAWSDALGMLRMAPISWPLR